MLTKTVNAVRELCQALSGSLIVICPHAGQGAAGQAGLVATTVENSYLVNLGKLGISQVGLLKGQAVWSYWQGFNVPGHHRPSVAFFCSRHAGWLIPAKLQLSPSCSYKTRHGYHKLSLHSLQSITRMRCSACCD